MTRVAQSLVQLGAVVLMIGVAVVYFLWGDIVRLTADDARNDIALWVWATDAAPGDTFSARARIDGGERASITGVAIEGAGRRQWAHGDGESWGDTITARGVDPASSTLDFAFEIPANARPGTTLTLMFEVHAVEARGMISRFTNEVTGESFTVLVRVYSHAESVLRRTGRAVLAGGSWIAVIVVLVFARGWYARRKRKPGMWWIHLAAPYACLGHVWFYAQMSAAVRLHGALLAMVATAVWLLAIAVAERLARYRYLPRYTVYPALIPTEGAAYRAAHVQATVKPIFDLEAAWSADGFVTLRRGRYLVVARRGVSIVPVPASESIGGEPFEVRSHDRDELIDLLEVASKVLGPLSCKELRDAPFPYVD